MAPPGRVGGVLRAAAVVLVVKDKPLRAEQAWRSTAGRGQGQEPGSRQSSPPSPSPGRQPEPLTCFSRRPITLGSSPASRPSWGWLTSKSTSWPCNFPLRGRRLTPGATRGCGCSQVPPGREGPPQGPSREGPQTPSPPEAAHQRHGGPGQDARRSGLHHLLQGLRLRPLDRGAQVAVVLEPCGSTVC